MMTGSPRIPRNALAALAILAAVLVLMRPICDGASARRTP
jgi:hypothetical protein